MKNYAYFVFPRSLSRTEIVCGFTNSVLTDRRMKLSPYSTKDNSPALKIKQTFGFSKQNFSWSPVFVQETSLVKFLVKSHNTKDSSVRATRQLFFPIKCNLFFSFYYFVFDLDQSINFNLNNKIKCSFAVAVPFIHILWTKKSDISETVDQICMKTFSGHSTAISIFQNFDNFSKLR